MKPNDMRFDVPVMAVDAARRLLLNRVELVSCLRGSLNKSSGRRPLSSRAQARDLLFATVQVQQIPRCARNDKGRLGPAHGMTSLRSE